MGEYHFSAELAQQYGLDEAIMLHNLAYWMRKNALDGRNIHDGQVWTFSSLEAFTEWFPFWSVKQIRRILASLEQQALIRKGNYNKRATDRTTWYTITAQDVLGCDGVPGCPVGGPFVVVPLPDQRLLFQAGQDASDLLHRPKREPLRKRLQGTERPHLAVVNVPAIQGVLAHPVGQIVEHDGFVKPILLGKLR